MRSFALAVFGLSLALAAHARADEWSKSYPITGKPQLAIETADANINVDTWEQNVIEAHVTTVNRKIGDGGITIVEHQAGDVVSIEVRFPHELVRFGSSTARVGINVHMPREGRIRLHTSDGSIHLSHLRGDMQIKTGDGYVQLDGVEGNLEAHTGDGDIHAAGRFDALDATTGDGGIEARALAGSTLRSNWKLQSGDGNVTLQVPPSLAAEIVLHSGDGQITADVPLTTQDKLGGSTVHGKMNGGGNLITINTGDGSIRLEKL